jgi:hypothetical protein
MSFKNLEQRFNEKVNDLYRASNQKFNDGKKSGGKFDEPFITRRPGSGYLSKFENRILPVRSALQDVKRISLFSLSNNGLLFLAKQQLLQTGNAFEQTRLINPLFPIIAAGLPGAGNLVRVRRHARPLSETFAKTDPYTAQKKWERGMLQQTSYNSSPPTAQTSPKFAQRLVDSLTSPFKNTWSAFTAKRNVGETYEWEYSRPELKKDNYILFEKLKDTQSKLSTTTTSTGPNSFNIANQKYSPNSNARYILDFSGQIPRLTTTATENTLKDKTYKDKSISEYKIFDSIGGLNLPPTKKSAQQIVSDQGVNFSKKNEQAYIKYFTSGQGSIVGSRATENDNGIERVSNKNARDIAASARSQNISLKISYIRDDSNLPQTNQQNVRSLAAYKSLPMIQSSQTSSFDDAIVVSFAIGKDNPIQFRAFIKDIDESVSPEYKTYQYIGRTEKFITYSSVQREVSFKLSVIAFSKEELQTVWKRINFLTGLAYPYGFNRGIMQPNIVKMTIGKLYENQPGYLTSISTNFNEVMESWDIDEQIPMGATVSLKFVLIEKKTKIAGSPFYAITENNSDFTNDLTSAPITQETT